MENYRKLLIGNRGEKSELTCKSPSRRQRSALDYSAVEEEDDDDESFYHKPRFLFVVMKSKRKRWVQHIVHMGKGEKYCWNVNLKLQGKRPIRRIIFK